VTSDVDSLAQRLRAFGDNHLSGALSLTADALGILRDVLDRETLPGVARALCEAQPAMAPVWNAALAALAGHARFEAFERRLERAPAALVRVTLRELDLVRLSDGRSEPLRVVTYSGSGSVLRVLEALATRRGVHVSVAEGRPNLEGRDLAERLARAGVAVDYYLDAALSHAIDQAALVLVGADAIGSNVFINKSGTRLVLAAAAHAHVPVYVVATRDKLAAPAVWGLLRLPEHAPAEIWPDSPRGIAVRNRPFEFVPCSLATAFLTDLGVLDAHMLPAACEGQEDPELLAALTVLQAFHPSAPRPFGQ
jgi:translation initiation factor 2B subunit (eIF-2B alpha/beta/delta family)